MATPEGTSRYVARLASAAAGHFRALASWKASSLGLGTYLGDPTEPDDAAYEEALLECLRHGVNVIDTAINYRCQRSERAIGRALRRAEREGIATRDELILSTKGGYLPFDGQAPASREEFLRYVSARFFERGVCGPHDLVGGVHCLAPAYLEDQLAASLANLGSDRVDIYFLHNPEQQIDEVDRPEFRRRIRAAFEVLERAGAEGKLTLYGAATWNGLRVPPEDRAHLSLLELLEIAEQVGGPDHRFRVLQLPYNLAMPEALLESTQPDGGGRRPVLDLARDRGIAVFCSASLLQARLVTRLPDSVAAAFPEAEGPSQRALQFVRSTPGVTTALVGMRSRPHVQENLRLAQIAPNPAGVAELRG